MNLAIDIGNTLVKMAVFDDGQLIDTFKSPDVGVGDLEALLATYPDVDKAIMASTRAGKHPIESFLHARLKRFVRFDASTPVPVANRYQTPESLGPDRLAAAVGAYAIYPETNVMIVDFGTAITIDLVTAEGEYLGGNISPGTAIRFRALHEFTGRLPLRTLTEETSLLGRTSGEAIDNGVINGIVYEIEGYIARLRQEYSGLRVIFTGGDGNYFAKRLKNPIFATYDLVVYGLNRILEHNAE